MRRIVPVLCLAALAAPAAAQVPSAADRADARCILLLNVVVARSAQDPQKRAQATEGVYFYVGRLSARGASARLGALLVSEAPTIANAQQAQAEFNRCSAAFNARTTELRAGIAQLQQAGQAARAAAAGSPPPKN